MIQKLEKNFSSDDVQFLPCRCKWFILNEVFYFWNIPSIWTEIFSYLTVTDLKNVVLACNYFKSAGKFNFRTWFYGRLNKIFRTTSSTSMEQHAGEKQNCFNVWIGAFCTNTNVCPCSKSRLLLCSIRNWWAKVVVRVL